MPNPTIEAEATRRARHEITRCDLLNKFGGVLVRPGTIPVPTWEVAYATALRDVERDERDRLELEALRKAFRELPVREQLIRSAELRLEIAEHGLAQPLDDEEIARLRADIDRSKAIISFAQAAE